MMEKYAIDAADTFRKWKKQYEGKPCTHMFYDVLYRAGPKSFETVRETAVQCAGLKVVKVVEGRSWEWGDHRELVWRKLHHCRYVRTLQIWVECPVCGQGHGSVVYRQEFLRGERANPEDDEIPF